jgi:high frequency lysogenization protein
MSDPMSDATLALAGVFQAAWMVREIAHRGSVRPDLFEVSIKSIFETDPPDTESVYGRKENLETGLRLLRDQLGGGNGRGDVEITKYVLAVLHLERKLVKNPRLMEMLRSGIARGRIQVGHFSFTHENVIAALADLYVKTVSTLTPRIIVSGQHGHLSNPANANKVRALLLAAIRSAVLWRQNGGNRLQLILRRRQFAGEANRLMHFGAGSEVSK